MVSANEEALTDSERSSNDKKNATATRSRAVLIVGAIACGLNCGIQLSGSYIIPITETACPKWSKSSTVIGQSLSLGVGAIAGVLNSRLVRRIGSRAALVLSLVLGALAYGLCGVTVSQCGLVAEIVYIILFAIMGVRANLLFFAWIDSLLGAFSARRHGFAVSIFPAAVAVGSIGYSQFFLFSQRLQLDGTLDASTVFFIVGLFVVVTTTIGIGVIMPVARPAPAADERRNSSRIVRERVKSRRFVFAFVGRFLIMLSGFGLISRQQDFLEVMWHVDHSNVIHLLLTYIMVVYSVARILWVFVSDRVGIKNLWVVTGAVQSFSLALMPIFIICNGGATWGRYVALLFFSLFMAGFSAPKSTLAAFVTEIWNSKEATVTTGMFSPSLGLAGLTGPLVLEAMYMTWNCFTYFLLVSSGLALVGVLLVIAVRKQRDCVRSIQVLGQNDAQIPN